jgi:hypothetical protein
MPIKIPDIPKTEVVVPQLPEMPKLLCDANSAVTQLTAAQSQIKELLKNKKAAAATLLSLIPSVQSKLNDVKAIVETADSFQSELKAISTSKNPVQIAQFIEKWSGSVRGLTELVAKAQSVANNPLAAFNYCTDVPNFNLNPLTGKVTLGSLSAIIPNINPAGADSLTSTVVDNTTKSSSGQSGATFADYQKYEDQVWPKVLAVASTVEDARVRGKILTYADRKAANLAGLFDAEKIAVYREKLINDEEYPDDSAYLSKYDEVDTILQEQSVIVISYARYSQNRSGS